MKAFSITQKQCVSMRSVGSGGDDEWKLTLTAAAVRYLLGYSSNDGLMMTGAEWQTAMAKHRLHSLTVSLSCVSIAAASHF